MNNNCASVAMALLYHQNCFLMQLRDDKPSILYPGHWGLFGGHLEAQETPQQGLIREVHEEIEYDLQQPQYFHCYSDREAARHIFYAPLTVEISALVQNEGQDLALVPIKSIQQGEFYSAKIEQTRKLGTIHRQILLDFVAFARSNQLNLS